MQPSVNTSAISGQNSLALVPASQNDFGVNARAGMENEAHLQAEGVVRGTKVVNDVLIIV